MSLIDIFGVKRLEEEEEKKSLINNQLCCIREQERRLALVLFQFPINCLYIVQVSDRDNENFSLFFVLLQLRNKKNFLINPHLFS